MGFRGRLTQFTIAICAAGGFASAPTAHAADPPRTLAADAGALRATVTADPWHVRFDGPAPQAALTARPGTGTGPVGALGFRTITGWMRATKVLTERRDGVAWIATLATTDPSGRTLDVRIAPAGDGLIRLAATAKGNGPAAVEAVGASFDAPAGERHLGFGERSNAVDQRGREVESYVAEGPYQDAEQPFLNAFVPGPGYRARDDATYFPIPWLLSTRGIGVLVEDDPVSTFRLGNDEDDAWSVAVNGTTMNLLVVAGPTVPKTLQRYTQHVGRQPPVAAPFYLGPWWQPTGKGNAGATELEQLRVAGATGSVVQTYTHYLPCGEQLDTTTVRERERTAAYHAAGLAVTTYFNPMVCTTYRKVYDEAARRGLLTKRADGTPYTYRYTGSAQFFVGQLDFTNPGTTAFFGDLFQEAVDDGYDGWMEDFGEYTPLDAVGADGSTGEAGHNAYVRRYHAAAAAYSKDRSPRPLARFVRSGFTGSAKHSQIVWGGDPSTTFGFDGLRSSVQNGLSMGLSGVSLWGSDVGGFFALSRPQTTPELLRRWLQVGFASGIMRTQANGFDLYEQDRAQIFDADVLPVWRRYARLRTQLYPYLAAAQKQYDATGLPLMRHLALAHPDDPRATARDDEFLLGDDLLAAPVLDPGRTERRAYLPAGTWVDWWRSVTLDADGAPRLGAPKVVPGGDDVTLPAPAEELPLLVRAGTVLPLLDPSVQTLAPYGKGKAVRLADRKDRLTLLAWPRGRREVALGPDRRDRAVSSEVRRGWVLKLRQGRTRTVRLQAALGTLAAGAFVPCRVLGGSGGRTPLRRGRAWTYDRATGVLNVTVRARDARLQVLRGCAR